MYANINDRYGHETDASYWLSFVISKYRKKFNGSMPLVRLFLVFS